MEEVLIYGWDQRPELVSNANPDHRFIASDVDSCLCPLFLLSRIRSVQFLNAGMREGESFGHIHSPPDYLDVCARFTLACRFHCGVELANRLNACCYPVSASQRPRQICIAPFRQIVVGPVWVWLQCPLHHIAVVVENKDDRIGTVAPHISDLVGG